MSGFGFAVAAPERVRIVCAGPRAPHIGRIPYFRVGFGDGDRRYRVTAIVCADQRAFGSPRRARAAAVPPRYGLLARGQHGLRLQ
jgi:hypothetical protein